MKVLDQFLFKYPIIYSIGSPHQLLIIFFRTLRSISAIYYHL